MTTEPPAAVPARGPIRTIVVDDAVELRALLRIVLRRTGRYEVVAEAGDGATAVELVAEHRPDLVMLDLSMPGMDGLEALPLMHRAAPETTVVILSGYQADRAATPALAAGAAGYLEKGLPPDRLVAELDRILDIGGDTVTRRVSQPTLDVPPAELVALAVHELRSPLAAARGFLELLFEDPATDGETAAEYAGQALRSLEGLDGLLDAMVRYVRETSRQLELTAVQLEPVVADVVAELAETHPDAAPRIAVASPLPTVRADRNGLAVILHHLLDNAVRHGMPPITVDAEREGNTIWLSVSNAGPPLPGDDILWQPFRRGSDAPTGGPGLGLALCSRLATAMGGALWAESSGDHGARLRLRLPAPRP